MDTEHTNNDADPNPLRRIHPDPLPEDMRPADDMFRWLITNIFRPAFDNEMRDGKE